MYVKQTLKVIQKKKIIITCFEKGKKKQLIKSYKNFHIIKDIRLTAT